MQSIPLPTKRTAAYWTTALENSGRGRDADCSAPPAQIRTCGITASGSCLRCGREAVRMGRGGRCEHVGAPDAACASCAPRGYGLVDCGGLTTATTVGPP